ncbi:S1/P1 nuclease [Lutibacter citreus]|uniref:S1/P1 nuclease n=1 Tax=Lutibacter citreus TaxID=2138210 RepID=UPI000DBE9388|nr:S1/P1 nuclease [Lutibacter citreus]
MNYFKKLAIFGTLLFTVSIIYSGNPEWGPTGHRTVGKIAEDYLSSKTKRKINDLLNGHSLAFVSTFGDDIKSDKRYNEFYTWHYVNMPFGVKYEDSKKNPKGDLVTGIKKCKEILLSKTASEEDKNFYLKMLVHLIGDLHQPMHVGRTEDKGGNDIQVRWFNNGTNLHRVWDSDMINHYNMTYTELANNTNSITKDQVKYLQKGSIEDWANETQKLAIKVYGTAKIGEKLGYSYMYENFELVRSQLQKGGIRLAKVLNDLFS